MTTAPTTASLHREMVEALRANQCRPELHRDQGRCIAGNIACQARAALEGWEKRPRLRDDEEMRAALLDCGFIAADADAILDALEPLLFGERG